MKEAHRSLTQEELQKHLSYSPDSGLFIWITATRGHKSGKVAGGINKRGYIRIKLGQVEYLAHRLAWLYMNGSFPENSIDHKNGVKDDNRCVNLRDVSVGANNANRVAVSNTGKIGVTRRTLKNGEFRFEASIRTTGKWNYLGTFKTLNEAVLARVAAEKKYNRVNLRRNV